MLLFAFSERELQARPAQTRHHRHNVYMFVSFVDCFNTRARGGTVWCGVVWFVSLPIEHCWIFQLKHAWSLQAIMQLLRARLKKISIHSYQVRRLAPHSSTLSIHLNAWLACDTVHERHFTFVKERMENKEKSSLTNNGDKVLASSIVWKKIWELLVCSPCRLILNKMFSIKTKSKFPTKHCSLH